MIRLLVEHLPISLLIGLAGYGWTGDGLCVPVALATGWLIDADHLFDFAYYAFRHYPNVDYRLLKNGGYFEINNKVFVPLHSWEITLLILIGGIAAGELALGVAAAVAHGAHLFQDQFRYRVRVLGYSLVSRLSSRFTLTGFCASS
jgi:hypothetical protein